ncbi:hypothetical protein EYF80_065804 [Liparis tanakae]|uniref:Uncharacterized protein n=1 Tax=Liparis tanakae TaxID=230148 RepID=A0A4Z2E5Z7_9TELE|nr:hypothetical protein EYF80_065804 [Liparis tanakae]
MEGAKISQETRNLDLVSPGPREPGPGLTWTQRAWTWSHLDPESLPENNVEITRSRSGSLDLWSSGALELWISGSLELWISGSLELWSSGSLDLWISGSLDLWISGSLDLWISGSLDL